MYLPVHNSNNYIINATTGFRFHLMRHCGNRTLYCVILSTDENMRQILSGGLVGRKKIINKNQKSLLPIDHFIDKGREKKFTYHVVICINASQENEIKLEI
uniref:Uncharacterized protein n=1 Tax=Schizaphis graminum TaxID=13262 RepID=A0A2S2NQD7_SCHGA